MSRSADDWGVLLRHCYYEFERHLEKYPQTTIGPFDYTGDHWVYPYLQAMEVFAADRDQAFQYGQEAQAQGNEYYFNEFIELAERIQEGGNQDAVRDGSSSLLLLESRYGKHHWKTLCIKLKEYGRPLYKGALEFSFDENIVSEHAKLLVVESLDQLENGYVYIPSELWHAPPDGTVRKEADLGLSWVEQVRVEAEFFKLQAEYNRATDLMNRYLIATLCLLPKGHSWYLNLSNQYKLSDAKTYIEGFYAKLYGKVEIETDEGRVPAQGANVIVTDPHDSRTWEAETDQEGHYEIDDAILHKLCSPFNIAAEYRGDQVESNYSGPLSEPDPSAEHEKNLLFQLPKYSAILKISHQSRSTNDYSDESRDYEVSLRLELSAKTPPPSEYAILSQSNVEITSTEIESYKGEIKLVEGPQGEKETKTWTLVDAEYLDPFRGISMDVPRTAMFRYDEEGKVKSVIFQAFSVKLSWSGPEGGACPSMVNVGPVSDSDNCDADSERISGRIEKALGPMASMRDGSFDMSKMGEMASMMSSISDLMGGVLDVATHQDYIVSTGDRFNVFGGRGEKRVEEIGSDSSMHTLDIFTWETRKKPSGVPIN